MELHEVRRSQNCFINAQILLTDKVNLQNYAFRPIDSLLHNDTKKELFSASIQLHNKLRSLPTSVAEAKGYIKAACAWLIVRTGDMKPSLAENYMKVFIRAGQELTAMENVEAKKVALNCLTFCRYIKPRW